MFKASLNFVMIFFQGTMDTLFLLYDSGSAIKSIFGQFKYNTGRKLDAANYRIARAAFLTKQASEGHHSGKGYRDMPLYVQTVPLEKKK